MTSNELYYEFQLLANKNATLQNMDISKGNFVILFNRELIKWTNEFIKLNNSTDAIFDIQGLLAVDTPLLLENKKEKYWEYSLPEKYFRFVDCSSLVERDECTTVINNFIEKPRDVKTNLENNIPSFDFEEGLCNITDQKVLISLGDFKINSTYLSYYKSPVKIDIVGYRRKDGNLSTNIDSDLDEIHQQEVINRTVLEVMREFENGNGYKLSVDRVSPK